jgi:hypothetical protein
MLKVQKNTFHELVAEKRLKYSKHRVVHRSAGISNLAIHLLGAEWSTVQRVRVDLAIHLPTCSTI